MKYVLLLLLLLYPTFSEEAIIKSKPIERINSPFEIKYGKIDAIDEELRCLSLAIYFEAKSLPEKGQALVAQVVLNRVASKKFPDTICKVVYQPSGNKKLYRACAYSFTCDRLPEVVTDHIAWDKAVQVAHKAIQGKYKHLTKADHYTTCETKVYWQDKMKYTGTDGVHCFWKS